MTRDMILKLEVLLDSRPHLVVTLIKSVPAEPITKQRPLVEIIKFLLKILECSPMSRETWVQSQVESYCCIVQCVVINNEEHVCI